MSDRIRTVLVGCGGISNAWLKTKAVQTDVELVGLVDLHPEAAERLRDQHGLPTDIVIGSDLTTVLEQTDPAVVFDCTIPEAHAEVTITALSHGCHVLGEKPMAASIGEGRRMVAAAEAAGKHYAVIQNRRYSPHIRRLQAFLASGAIGTVHTVHADFFIAANFGGFRAEMDHVLLLDMAIHSFDQARLLTPGKPVRVVADDWNPPGSWYRHGASAWAAFTMDGGQRFVYRGSWTATGQQTSWECAWRIYGDRGAVTWDGGDGFAAERVVDMDQPAGRDGGPLIRDLEPVDVPEGPAADTMRRGHDGVISEFLRCVRDGGEPETRCQDNVLSLAMVHAAIASAEAQATPVPIE